MVDINWDPIHINNLSTRFISTRLMSSHVHVILFHINLFHVVTCSYHHRFISSCFIYTIKNLAIVIISINMITPGDCHYQNSNPTAYYHHLSVLTGILITILLMQSPAILIQKASTDDGNIII